MVLSLSATVTRLLAVASETARKPLSLCCGDYTYQRFSHVRNVPVCRSNNSKCSYASPQEWEGNIVYFCDKGSLTARQQRLTKQMHEGELSEGGLSLLSTIALEPLVEHGLVKRTPHVTRVADGKGHLMETSVDYYSLPP